MPDTIKTDVAAAIEALGGVEKARDDLRAPFTYADRGGYVDHLERATATLALAAIDAHDPEHAAKVEACIKSLRGITARDLYPSHPQQTGNPDYVLTDALLDEVAALMRRPAPSEPQPDGPVFCDSCSTTVFDQNGEAVSDTVSDLTEQLAAKDAEIEGQRRQLDDITAALKDADCEVGSLDGGVRILNSCYRKVLKRCDEQQVQIRILTKWRDEVTAAIADQPEPEDQPSEAIDEWLKEYEQMTRPLAGGGFITREQHALAELCRRSKSGVAS